MAEQGTPQGTSRRRFLGGAAAAGVGLAAGAAVAAGYGIRPPTTPRADRGGVAVDGRRGDRTGRWRWCRSTAPGRPGSPPPSRNG